MPDVASEPVAVEMISPSQFAQVTKGEERAKAAPPNLHADVEADVPRPAPRPPTPNATEDVATPPPSIHVPDPGQDALPPTPPSPPVAATPPPRPPDPPKPQPAPPSPPAPVPPPRPAPPPPPPDAAAIDPPKPPTHPKVAQLPKTPPLPPVDKPPPRPPQLKVDKIQKLLDERKLAQILETSAPTSHPRNTDTRRESEHLDPTAISALLSHDEAKQRASTGRVSHAASSAGAAQASASSMSQTLWGALDGFLVEQYRTCWHMPPPSDAMSWVPQIQISYRVDGSLASEPLLKNTPIGPEQQSLAESALRAVRECNPLKIPSQFAPYYSEWKTRTINFDPKMMSEG